MCLNINLGLPTAVQWLLLESLLWNKRYSTSKSGFGVNIQHRYSSPQCLTKCWRYQIWWHSFKCNLGLWKIPRKHPFFLPSTLLLLSQGKFLRYHGFNLLTPEANEIWLEDESALSSYLVHNMVFTHLRKFFSLIFLQSVVEYKKKPIIVLEPVQHRPFVAKTCVLQQV